MARSHPMRRFQKTMAPVSFNNSEKAGIYLVRPSGYLDETGGVELRLAFDVPLQKGFKKFLLDLKGAPVINSQGITQILELGEALLYDQKATLAITGLSELYLDVFQVVGITKFAKIYGTEEEALKALGG